MSGKELSHRRKQILDYIVRATKEVGYPPTVREIGDGVGLRSSSTVHFHLNVLQKMGLIERDGSLTRAIRARDVQSDQPTPPTKGVRYAPLVGRVAAGQPIFAAENIEDTHTLPAALFPDGDLFMLEINGNSMIEDSIVHGDLVVVQRRETAEDGDIVVALLDDEATVKRLFRHNGDVELRPANAAMESIFTHEVAVLGRVCGVIRRI